MQPPELEELNGLMSDESVNAYAKVGVAALLDDKESFEVNKNQLSETDFRDLSNMPISRFFPK